MKNLFLLTLILLIISPVFSQDDKVKSEQLSEVVVLATNYKYYDNVSMGEEAAIPVELLERKVAAFDVTESDFYNDEYDLYKVSFFIPDGKILVAYDKDGKVLRTVEKFKDISLPKDVRDAVVSRFPNWVISKNIYLVNYSDTKGANIQYKIKLENGDKTMRIKTDEKGNFL